MKTVNFFTLLALLTSFLASCTKDIDRNILSRERSILDIKLQGQLGSPRVERDGNTAKIKLFILDTNDFSYGNVNIEGLVVSSGATANVDKGSKLDFFNPEHKAKITVTSASGDKMDWSVYLEPYNAFYVGTWRIEDIKIYVDQNLSGVGTAKWETQMSGSEFGHYVQAEYDNRITITMTPSMVNGGFTGVITNNPGVDKEFGSFKGVYPGEYSIDAPLDMNSRLRHLIPTGEATWSLNLSSNEMKITKNNITSTMTFATDSWGNTLFEFTLPNATTDPAGSNFYNNFWRSSYKLSYILRKVE